MSSFLALGLALGACTATVDVDATEAVTNSTTAPETTTTAQTTTTTAPATTTTEEVVLDYSQIEGAWTGEGIDGFETFSIVAELEADAPMFRPVGTVSYPGCRGTWLAASAEHPVYVLHEQINQGNCPDGVVRLVLDPDTGALDYEFTAGEANPALDATGTLNRSDS